MYIYCDNNPVIMVDYNGSDGFLNLITTIPDPTVNTLEEAEPYAIIGVSIGLEFLTPESDGVDQEVIADEESQIEEDSTIVSNIVSFFNKDDTAEGAENTSNFAGKIDANNIPNIYCDNNPVTNIDPLGTDFWSWLREQINTYFEYNFDNNNYGDYNYIGNNEDEEDIQAQEEQQQINNENDYILTNVVGRSAIFDNEGAENTEVSRENWGSEHGKGNIQHNNAIEDELDMAEKQGATDLGKNRVQRDALGNRVYTSSGNYVKPDASYTINGIRFNTNYVSNINDLDRELIAFDRMCEADPNAVNSLIIRY